MQRPASGRWLTAGHGVTATSGARTGQRRLGRVAAHIPIVCWDATGDSQQAPGEEAADIIPFAGSAGMGAEVVGLDLRACLFAGWGAGHESVDVLRSAVTAHGLLLFRGQLPRLSADELVDFSKWFGCGRLHSAHKNHHAAEHPDVFRVSNNPDFGCWEDNGVGSQGFHNDGAFMPAPYSHAIYQIVEAPSLGGDTTFANINKCLSDYIGDRGPEGADSAGFLSQLLTVNDIASSLAFPIVHYHPYTARALVLLNGFKRALRRIPQEDGTEKMEELGKDDKARVRQILRDVIEDSTGSHYIHRWLPGDVIITDNLAVAHRAAKQLQATSLSDGVRGAAGVAEHVPLRILHRTTVLGTHMLGLVLDDE